MKDRAIAIESEGQVMPKTSVTFHIDYKETLTLKELSEVLDLINKAINDVNRKNGIKNNATIGKEYAAEVTGVESGSIIIHILTSFVAPVALSVLANFIYDRLKTIGAKNDKKTNSQIKDAAYPISINVVGNDNLIELNVSKSSD